MQECPLNFTHPLVSLREKQGTQEAEGTEGTSGLGNQAPCLSHCGPDTREDRS